MQELMQQQSQQQTQQQVQQQMQEAELRKKISYIARNVLTPEARERLGNIRARDKTQNTDYSTQIELLLVQLYQAGKLPHKLTDQEFKTLLDQIRSGQRERKITFK